MDIQINTSLLINIKCGSKPFQFITFTKHNYFLLKKVYPIPIISFRLRKIILFLNKSDQMM